LQGFLRVFLVFGVLELAIIGVIAPVASSIVRLWFIAGLKCVLSVSDEGGERGGKRIGKWMNKGANKDQEQNSEP
jgi:hypothetical protein